MPHIPYCIDVIEQQQMLLPAAAHLLVRAGDFLIEQAHYKDAERLTQHALAIYEQLFGPNHSDVALGLEQLAWIYFIRREGKANQAESLYLRAIEIYQQTFGSNHPDAAECYNDLAILYGDQGKYEQAESLLQRAFTDLQPELDIHIRAQETWPVFFSEVVECLNTLALLYQDQRKDKVAEQYHQQALVLIQQGWSSNDIFKMKREREVLAFETRAHAIREKNQECDS
jgi:tetratricopeptide (TPR) repeat protein